MFRARYISLSHVFKNESGMEEFQIERQSTLWEWIKGHGGSVKEVYIKNTYGDWVDKETKQHISVEKLAEITILSYRLQRVYFYDD